MGKIRSWNPQVQGGVHENRPKLRSILVATDLGGVCGLQNQAFDHTSLTQKVKEIEGVSQVRSRSRRPGAHGGSTEQGQEPLCDSDQKHIRKLWRM
jgi:hypothetical protein